MLTKRIIPCLDLNQGRVVKGIQFQNLQDAGDPLDLIEKYYQQGADEISILDISASYEQRNPVIELIKEINRQVFIPLSVGGGIRTLDDAQQILNAGAEKVSIGTAAVQNPNLITAIADRYGSQAVVLSLDLKLTHMTPSGWEVFIFGGREATGLDGIDFGQKMVNYGVGELLLNSIDRDGTQSGFNIKMLRKFTESVKVPLIASGGAGTKNDFVSIFKEGKADAALAASIFHYGTITIPEVKSFLKQQGIQVRIV